MATPHIAAAPGDIAPLVLMPGDPRRARRIAESLLDGARLVTDVRGIEGYTGRLGPEPVSVLASGMGIPSIMIYATELFRHYGVRRIVRVGTAGALSRHLEIRDVVVASAAHTDSSVARLRVDGVTLSLAPSFSLLNAAGRAAAAASVDVHVGPVLTSDHFYLERRWLFSALEAHGTLAVEMEAAGLYAAAAAEGGEAVAILTITDHVHTGEALSAAERETGFERMVQIAGDALTSA